MGKYYHKPHKSLKFVIYIYIYRLLPENVTVELRAEGGPNGTAQPRRPPGQDIQRNLRGRGFGQGQQGVAGGAQEGQVGGHTDRQTN